MISRIQPDQRPPIDMGCPTATFVESQYYALCAANAGTGRRAEDRESRRESLAKSQLLLTVSRSLDAERMRARDQILGVAQILVGAAGCVFAIAGVS